MHMIVINSVIINTISLIIKIGLSLIISDFFINPIGLLDLYLCSTII